jgi:hypothetical protein
MVGGGRAKKKALIDIRAESYIMHMRKNYFNVVYNTNFYISFKIIPFKWDERMLYLLAGNRQFQLGTG